MVSASRMRRGAILRATAEGTRPLVRLRWQYIHSSIKVSFATGDSGPVRWFSKKSTLSLI
ncbi:hypothetical protein OIE68_42835 [Nocardia vinacea]|uniref:Uncharacterized protein n=1 Tax=Nocardia vinacea TaxID=96468 RepID=A0ABZ1YK82_9NOCA|nr:hypothetical protein OIE68_42835 [Nocardia vinacea]